MSTPRLVSIALGLVIAAPLAADAKPKPKGRQSAKAHVDKATKAHKAGKFDVALVELQAAHKIDPQPRLLFAIAQVYAKLGNCTDAVGHYKQFVATAEGKKKKAVVEQAIQACKDDPFAQPKPAATDKPGSDAFRKRQPDEGDADKPGSNDVLPDADKPSEAGIDKPPAIEASPGTPPLETPSTSSSSSSAEAPPPAAAEPAAIMVAPPPERPAGSPWYRDPIGDALVIGGVAAGVASLVFYRGATSALDDAEAATTLDDYNTHVDDAHSQRTISVVLAGGAVALVGAGILRFALRDNGESRRVAVVPAEGGGIITWSGGF